MIMRARLSWQVLMRLMVDGGQPRSNNTGEICLER